MALTPDEAVKGLEDFARKLKTEGGKALEVATKLIEPVARKNLARQPVPNRPGVIERRSGATPQIILNYSTFPWAAGAEAGSHKFRQFKRYVGFGDSGYIVGAAIRSTEKVVGAGIIKHLESELKEEL